MAQIRVVGGAPAANLARARAAIDAAADRGCDVVVLPECLDLGWTHPSARERAEPIPGARSRLLAERAAARGILVAAGLVEREVERRFNAAVLIDRTGRIVLHHRKINELHIARPLYEIGDRVAVGETDLGRIAVNVCADNFEESLAIGRAQGQMGARLLLTPSAWVVRPDHDHDAEPYEDRWLPSFRALAHEFDMPVVGVSHVGEIAAGPWTGRRAIGRSLLVGADGSVVAAGPYGPDAEELVVADVVLS